MSDKQKTIRLTAEGLKTLQAELKNLNQNKLPKAIERVATAREFGDLAENAEYHSAREDHAWIMGRIEEIEAILKQAEVVQETKDRSEIAMGSQVVLVTEHGQEHEYHLVGEWEADPMAKKISLDSPLGQALLGKKVGDIAEVEAPAGQIVYSVKSIK